MSEQPARDLPAFPGGGDDVDPLAGLDEEYAGPDDATPAGPRTMLDELRDEVARPIEREPLVVQMRERAGWSVVYDLTYTADDHKTLQRRATNRRRTGPGAGELDNFLLNRLVLATKCAGLRRRGEDVTDGDGRRLTFRSRAFLDVMGVDSAAKAVSRWYAGDEGGLAAHAAAIVDGSGFSEDDLTADPTEELSTD